jgi:hypothetical protein
LLNLSEDNESIAEVIQYKMRWEDDSEWYNSKVGCLDIPLQNSSGDTEENHENLSPDSW